MGRREKPKVLSIAFKEDEMDFLVVTEGVDLEETEGRVVKNIKLSHKDEKDSYRVEMNLRHGKKSVVFFETNLEVGVVESILKSVKGESRADKKTTLEAILTTLGIKFSIEPDYTYNI